MEASCKNTTFLKRKLEEAKKAQSHEVQTAPTDTSDTEEPQSKHARPSTGKDNKVPSHAACDHSEKIFAGVSVSDLLFVEILQVQQGCQSTHGKPA